jgi:tetratricopeptide (TPR) repeat protein
MSDVGSAALSSFKAGRLVEAVSLCRAGIERAQSQGEQDKCWRLRILLALCLCSQGDFAGSVALLEIAPITADVSIETRVRILNQKAFALSRSGNFRAAKSTLDSAYDLACQSALPSLVAEVEINRCTLAFYLARYDEVEVHARVALEIGERENLPLTEASACSGVGKSAMYRERQADAIPWFERALTIYEREGATAYADIMRSELGCCHLALGQDDTASGYFTRALKASRDAGALASVHIDLANMGWLHLKRGEFAAAISHFQEALQIARELGDSISVSKWLGNLALAYYHMGNSTLAAGFREQSERVAEKVDQARAFAGS